MASAAIDFCRAIWQIAHRPGNYGAHAPSLRGQAEASAADRNNANNRNNDNGFRVVVVHASRRTAHHPGSSELPGWFSAEPSSPASNARRRPARRRAAAKKREMAQPGPGRRGLPAAGIYRSGPVPAPATRRLGRATLACHGLLLIKALRLRAAATPIAAPPRRRRSQRRVALPRSPCGRSPTGIKKTAD